VETRIKERYSDAILEGAVRRFGIAPDRIRLLDGFESFMYEFERDGGDYILRIGHSLRRNENLIQGEVDWINYLAAGGASVAGAVLSEQGNLVEASSWPLRLSELGAGRPGRWAGPRRFSRPMASSWAGCTP
jgi:Ser/Thr protein kinase RdoA (MazF antagonist)